MESISYLPPKSVVSFPLSLLCQIVPYFLIHNSTSLFNLSVLKTTPKYSFQIWTLAKPLLYLKTKHHFMSRTRIDTLLTIGVGESMTLETLFALTGLPHQDLIWRHLLVLCLVDNLERSVCSFLKASGGWVDLRERRSGEETGRNERRKNCIVWEKNFKIIKNVLFNWLLNSLN